MQSEQPAHEQVDASCSLKIRSCFSVHLSVMSDVSMALPDLKQHMQGSVAASDPRPWVDVQLTVVFAVLCLFNTACTAPPSTLITTPCLCCQIKSRLNKVYCQSQCTINKSIVLEIVYVCSSL